MKLNDQPVPPPPAAPTPKKVNAAVLFISAAVIVTVPLLAFLAIYMWLNQTWFSSIDEVEPAKLESVQVRMLNLIRGPQNRPGPPLLPDVPPEENNPTMQDPDIDPVNLVRPDFEVIFLPLRGATLIEHSQWPAAVFLGEIRVRDKEGRPGTIRLYRAADELPKGQKLPDDPKLDPRVQRVYMRIGSSWYRACTLKELRECAHASAERGTKAGR